MCTNANSLEDWADIMNKQIMGPVGSDSYIESNLVGSDKPAQRALDAYKNAQPKATSMPPMPQVNPQDVSSRRRYLARMRQGILANIKTGPQGITGALNNQGSSSGKKRLGE